MVEFPVPGRGKAAGLCGAEQSQQICIVGLVLAQLCLWGLWGGDDIPVLLPAAHSSYPAQGGHGHLAGHPAAGEQHQRVPGDRRGRAHHSGPAWHGQAHRGRSGCVLHSIYSMCPYCIAVTSPALHWHGCEVQRPQPALSSALTAQMSCPGVTWTPWCPL